MPTTHDFAIVIPARYASSRFPGKPLVDILGKPMIQRTWEQCVMAVPTEQIFIATDDERIASACQEFGARVVMTGDDCLTGTDRVAEAAQHIDADFLVNVQGDEPILDPQDILKVADAFRKSGGLVTNGMAPIKDEAEFRSYTIPKVVARPDGRLMYMSRAPIPSTKGGDFRKAWKQICVYAFSREHLSLFSSVKIKGPIEEIEDIEILRFLELGHDVQMVELESSSMAVDTPEDLERVCNAIQSR